MDLSALIFVALAVAWAVYLIPKALRHHEESTASRGVDGFSERMRVLARREPVDRKTARLVVTPGRATSTARPVLAATVKVEPVSAEPVEVEPTTPARAEVPASVRRAAARRAAKRRLRVVALIVLSLIVVGVLSRLGHVAVAYLAIPGGLLVAWLVACRAMVKKERATMAPSRRLPLAAHEPTAGPDEGPITEEIRAVIADPPAAGGVVDVSDPPPANDSGGWDLVPVTLPTYVDKEPAARRTVRTIDLDSTGVWTSGRTAADSVLAREADQARESARTPRASSDERRASGD